MKTILTISLVVISLLLCLSVLSQAKGEGLSATFGGQGGFYHTKRGAEKVLFILTVVFAVLFVANSIAFVFVR